MGTSLPSPSCSCFHPLDCGASVRLKLVHFPPAFVCPAPSPLPWARAAWTLPCPPSVRTFCFYAPNSFSGELSQPPPSSSVTPFAPSTCWCQFVAPIPPTVIRCPTVPRSSHFPLNVSVRQPLSCGSPFHRFRVLPIRRPPPHPRTGRSHFRVFFSPLNALFLLDLAHSFCLGALSFLFQLLSFSPLFRLSSSFRFHFVCWASSPLLVCSPAALPPPRRVMA